MSGGYETAGKFYWPSDHYSIPADNLCWHVPPSPNADFRCIRPDGHPGKHKYEWSPTTKDHSHKLPNPPMENSGETGNARAAASMTKPLLVGAAPTTSTSNR